VDARHTANYGQADGDHQSGEAPGPGQLAGLQRSLGITRLGPAGHGDRVDDGDDTHGKENQKARQRQPEVGGRVGVVRGAIAPGRARAQPPRRLRLMPSGAGRRWRPFLARYSRGRSPTRRRRRWGGRSGRGCVGLSHRQTGGGSRDRRGDSRRFAAGRLRWRPSARRGEFPPGRRWRPGRVGQSGRRRGSEIAGSRRRPSRYRRRRGRCRRCGRSGRRGRTGRSGRGDGCGGAGRSGTGKHVRHDPGRFLGQLPPPSGCAGHGYVGGCIDVGPRQKAAATGAIGGLTSRNGAAPRANHLPTRYRLSGDAGYRERAWSRPQASTSSNSSVSIRAVAPHTVSPISSKNSIDRSSPSGNVHSSCR
jgi:hypothetical protein